ncbi:MAG: thioredoxin family protein [Acidimicrobiia bacterium]|nr:thioredoxin family protein [Acidimicrobiia bacterium]
MFADYDNPTLIEVKTPHCVECRAMQSDLDAVAAQHEGVVDLLVIDATEEPDQVASWKVIGTPTLIAVKDGTELARYTGRRSRSELVELFKAVAQGDTSSVATVSRSDLQVSGIAGVLLTGVGLLTGPSWILVAIGVGLGGYALIRSAGR